MYFLTEIGHNHFDVLPEGWVQVTHNSGMPLYLHKQTRVCTLSQPYFLGPGSARVSVMLQNIQVWACDRLCSCCCIGFYTVSFEM